MQGDPSLISVITFLGGVQLISVAVLGEYVGKTYFEATRRPVDLIRDIIHSGQPAAAPMRPATTAIPAHKAQVKGRNHSAKAPPRQKPHSMHPNRRNILCWLRAPAMWFPLANH